MTELLRLESCSVFREGRLLPVFHDISLAVRAGERLNIIGPSGSGKTTLALVIAGLLKPSTGRVVRLPPLRRRRAPIRMIFQDPFASMNPRWRVGDWLKDNCPTPASLDHLVDLCDKLELPLDLLQQHPLELSGGECQRFNLIGALLGNPLLLILDEALSMVDGRAAQAMDMLIESQRDGCGMGVIAIEHNAKVSEGRIFIEMG